jgi:hypothetical protein
MKCRVVDRGQAGKMGPHADGPFRLTQAAADPDDPADEVRTVAAFAWGGPGWIRVGARASWLVVRSSR